MDSSRVSTFLISILLIVYGSFRSLNMEQEAREREKEKERSNLLTGITSTSGTSDSGNNGSVQTLDTMHALCLPLGASISLLVMFFFFDSMQMLFAICTASKLHLQHPIHTSHTYLNAKLQPKTSFHSYSYGGTGFPSVADVSVHHPTLFRRQQNLVRSLRKIHRR